jgi:hypothetical protein
MIALVLFILAILASPFKSQSRLEAENAALRHQLTVLRRKLHGRVRLTNNDRLFFIQLYRWFPSVLKAITIIRPETLVRWHRAGFRRYWRCERLSRRCRREKKPKLAAMPITWLGWWEFGQHRYLFGGSYLQSLCRSSSDRRPQHTRASRRWQELNGEGRGQQAAMSVLIPVMLPPGRLRLATKPLDTGSSMPVNMIGIVVVTAFAAAADGLPPAATINATWRRTRSEAKSGNWS